MSTLNRPNRFTLDSFSDIENGAGRGTNGKFRNKLQTPILNAKGIQLLSANFVNSTLQLNDYSQLMFWYYGAGSSSGLIAAANLQCVRLLPSWYVPYPSFTAYTPNQYFNSVTDLIAALNLAASTGGDSVTYNGYWSVGSVVFSWDPVGRRINISSTNNLYIAPAAIDDPNVQQALTGGGYGGPLLMHGYAANVLQPYSLSVGMNNRLGYALSYMGVGAWWSGTSVIGCATATGVPVEVGIVADEFPILLGSQNVNVYLDICLGGGLDSRTGKNMVASIPLDAPALNVIAYTASGVREPVVQVPNEIYEVEVRLTDETGTPFHVPRNYNMELAFAVTY